LINWLINTADTMS